MAIFAEDQSFLMEKPTYTKPMKLKSLAQKMLQRKHQYENLRDPAPIKAEPRILDKQKTIMAGFRRKPACLSSSSSFYDFDQQECGVVASPTFSNKVSRNRYFHVLERLPLTKVLGRVYYGFGESTQGP